MNAFSRRTFLKGILSTAAVLNVPVDLIEQATRAIELVPDTPITLKHPTCYLRINDLIVPIGYIEILQQIHGIDKIYAPSSTCMGRFDAIGYNRSAIGNECELIFSTTKDYFSFHRRNNEKVKFSIVSDKIPFEISGIGYFNSFSYGGGIVSSDEFEQRFLYNNTITGLLTKRDGGIG